MLRDMDDLNGPRDTFMVMGEEDGMFRIRKMKDKVRMKTYLVKREQIILVFTPDDIMEHPDMKSEDVLPESLPLTPPPSTQRPKRKSALKSRLQTHQLASDKIIKIKRKDSEDHDSPGWVYILQFSNNDDARNDANNNDDDNPDENNDLHPDDSDGPNRPPNRNLQEDNFLFDIDFSFSDADQDPLGDDDWDRHLPPPTPPRGQDVRQRPDEEGSERDLSSLSNDSDKGLSDDSQVSSISIRSMRPSERDQLVRDLEASTSEVTDQSSMEWDNNSLTVNLSNPLARSRLFTDNSESDDVFTLNLEVPLSPISPDQRITRNLVRSGAYARHAESSSDLSDYQFQRLDPLRRPLLRVRFEDDLQNIADTNSAQAQSWPAEQQPPSLTDQN